MKTKRFLSLALAFCMSASISLMAQSIEVVGQVLDSLTHEGEPMATLRILKGEETAVQGVTDNEGLFKLELKSTGNYLLNVTSIGRTPIVRPFEVKNGQKRVDLGVMLISESAKALKEVSVAIQKPIVKMEGDKVAYSIKDDPDAKGHTILDMLRKVPMVTVDGQDNIMVNGSSSFQIYFNGKPSPMLSANPSTTLKAMPTDGIRNIEVLTNPGAKYDAEGAGGILNIITDQDSSLEGLAGNLSLMTGNRLTGIGAYVMVQKGKLTMSVNANENYITSPDMEMSYCTDNMDTQMLTEYSSTSNGHSNSAFGNIDLSYEINPSNSLGASFSLMDMNSKQTSTALTTILHSGSLMQDYTTQSTSRTHMPSINGSVDYQHIFGGDMNHSLLVAYRIGTRPMRSQSESEYSLSSMPDYDQTNRSNMLEHTFQLDYSLPLNAKSTVETGGKYVWRQSLSETDYLDYSHTSNIGAIYGTYSLNLGSYNLKGGLRYEHTEQEVTYRKGNGTDFKVNYDNLVPNVTLGFVPKMGQNIALAYNMRISRPGISLLNPYRDTTNPISQSYGNPDLEVEKVHNAQLTYNYYSMKLMLNATAHYSFQDNGIEQYSYHDNNVLYTTYGNIARRQNAGVSLFASWSVTPSTRLMLNGTSTYVDLCAKQMGLSNSGWQHSLMMNIQQTLWWDVKLSAMYMPSTPTISLQGENAAFSMHMLGLTKTFLKDRLSIAVNTINPLSRDMKMKTTQSGTNFTNHSTSTISIRSVMCNISYRFGDMKQKPARRTANFESDVRDERSQSDQMNDVFMNK